jgi:hypothetical protein
MKYLSSAVLVLAFAGAAAAQPPGAAPQPPTSGPPGAQRPPTGTPPPGTLAGPPGSKASTGTITLTGCVTAGTEKNTYVLNNVIRSDAPPGATSPTAVYWLDSPEKLKGHVGHRVEIEGTLDTDVDKTAVKEKDGKVSLTRERTKTVTAPPGSAAAQDAKALGTETKHPGYKVKVKTVKMLAAGCPA